ncbi:MAG TPA: hypothetical protein P5186_12755 [Candidatus Paceibacterota bacterium]|nr:hypothetical protein [Verrucomicrobiota bacterium]HRY48910.1 hypothetical protein [Candidatus Paceibacterota bacterium]HRZ99122.1 hypothetical protein [Candidatus Paceibacterota bacterium]
MKLLSTWAGILAICLLPIPYGGAWQGFPLEIGPLIQRADAVVHGQVTGKSCRKDEAGRIYTRIELRILEVWKGRTDLGELNIVHSGGEWQGETARTTGQVQYNVGEEVVAFVVWNQRGEGVTVGLAQGKFSVIPQAHPTLLEVKGSTATSGVLSPKIAVRPGDSMALSLTELRRLVREATR